VTTFVFDQRAFFGQDRIEPADLEDGKQGDEKEVAEVARKERIRHLFQRVVDTDGVSDQRRRSGSRYLSEWDRKRGSEKPSIKQNPIKLEQKTKS